MTTPHFVDALRRHADRTPERPFAWVLRRGRWTTITYGALARQASAFAALYRESGLKEGDPVLVALQHGPDVFAPFLGAALGGFIPSYMPFPSRKQAPERYWETHRPLFERIGRGAIVTWQEHAGALREVLRDVPMKTLEPEDAAPFADAPLPGVTLHRDRTALLQHSSGTTGLKKGVELSFGIIADQIESVSRAARFEPESKIAHWLPLYHDMGLIGCFITPLTLGISVAALDPFEWVVRPHLLLDAIERHSATHCWIPNFALHHLVRTTDPDASYDLGSLRALVIAGEPCKRGSIDTFVERFESNGISRETIQIGYGMAENVFILTQTTVGEPAPWVEVDEERLLTEGRAVDPEPDARAVSIMSVGKPIDGAEYRIEDADGNPLPDDRVGEIATWGRFTFSGYYKDPALTRSRMRDGRYLTGDLGFRRNGELYAMGRKDDRIIVLGKNFFAHDIEFVAGRVDGVKGGRCVAIGVFSEELGSEEVVLISEAAHTDESRYESLRAAIREAVLDELNLPVKDTRVVPPGWVIKTTSGKMDRKDNYEKYLALMRTLRPEPGEASA